MTELRALPLRGIPEVVPGDDLAGALAAAAERAGGLKPGDVVVVAHKVVSKAEGAVVELADVTPTARARFIAQEHGKDPRAVQVVLDQTAEIVRVGPGVLICRTHHGFVCANAGVDASNAGAADRLVTLPRDPDASARALRAAIPGRPAVVISDSFGRAWRHGQTEAAIGVAGPRTARGLARTRRRRGPRAARDLDRRRRPGGRRRGSRARQGRARARRAAARSRPPRHRRRRPRRAGAAAPARGGPVRLTVVSRPQPGRAARPR